MLSLAELLACGLTEAAIGRRVAAGRLHRIHRGVFAVGHPGLTDEGRWLAAVKACGPGSLLSHYCAGMLLAFLELHDRRPDVLVPHGRARVVAGIRVRRTRALAPQDAYRHRGIPVTSPARTLLDLAATMQDKPLRRAMSRAQSLRLTSLPQLAGILDRTGTRPGRARFARVLASGPKPTRSELEDRVLDLIRAGGFATPDVNVPLRLDGRRIIPDFRWPEQRLIVEADGSQWHENPQARAEDAERQALLEAHGERVLRVTWKQTVAHIEQTRQRLAAAGAPRHDEQAVSEPGP